MKAKLINAHFTIREYMAEITKPDARFRTGRRPTGKFEAKSGIEVSLILELQEGIQLRDVIITNELGKFIVVEVNMLTNQCTLRSVSINSFEHRSFSVQGVLDIAIGVRVRGESSR